MPRAGDGSGDSGPYEAHEIVHGTDGDTSLKHTQHVAPLPSQEAGDALPGLNASGGGVLPSKGDAEEYYGNNPVSEEYTQSSTAGSKTTGTRSHDNYSQSQSQSKTSTSTSSSRQQNTQSKTTSTSTSTSASTSTDKTHALSAEQESHLGQISREKAEKYVNLDEDNNDAAPPSGSLSQTQTQSKSQTQSQPRTHEHEHTHHSAPKSSSSSSSSETKTTYAAAAGHATSATKESHSTSTSNSSTQGHKTRGSADEESSAHKFEQVQRDKAEKFGGVNLQDE